MDKTNKIIIAMLAIAIVLLIVNISMTGKATAVEIEDDQFSLWEFVFGASDDIATEVTIDDATATDSNIKSSPAQPGGDQPLAGGEEQINGVYSAGVLSQQSCGVLMEMC